MQAVTLRDESARQGGFYVPRYEIKVKGVNLPQDVLRDVMQVTYLEAFLHIDQLTARDTSAFLAWLTRIAENAIRDAVRGLTRTDRVARRATRHPPANIPSPRSSMLSLLSAEDLIFAFFSR